MVLQLFIGGIIIGITVLFQAIAFDVIIKRSRWLEARLNTRRSMWKAFFLTVIILAVICVLIVEIWIWALFYLAVDALPDLETALYFSVSTFTTVGFGDVVLSKEWRIIGSVEATNGFLLFGWSAAFIFEIVSTVYRREGRDLQR